MHNALATGFTGGSAKFFSNKLRATCVAAALTVMAVASASAAPTLINGSLTGEVIDGWGHVPAGWTVVQPSPDTNNGITVADNAALPSGTFQHAIAASDSPDGGTWIGMVGGGGFSESFSQSVSGFTIGNSYTLSWYHANFGMLIEGSPSGTGPGAIQVLANGALLGTGAMRDMIPGWVDESITFVADATTIDLTFGGVESGYYYQSIDGIRLTDNSVVPPNAVPEPAALSLFSGAGLAMLLASRRRKQAKQAA